MTSRARKFQTPSLCKAFLWILMAALLLALSLGLRSTQGLAEGQASGVGAEEQSETSITYTYDAAGRLVGADYGEGQVITYTYDANGNLLQR
jgi:YD repeat-containing protein